MSVPFIELAETSAAVAATSGRNAKVELLASLLRRLTGPDVVPTVCYLTGTTPWGRIGVGWSALGEARVTPSARPTLSVADVTDVLGRLTAVHGSGSAAVRRDTVRELFAAATEAEQRLLAAVLGGELRQGANAGVMTTAIARAADVQVSQVRRGAMMAGDLSIAAHAALVGGIDELATIDLVPLRPIQPMLASPGSVIADAMGEGAQQVVEAKLDGARIQAHRAEGRVLLVTRNLNDVTDRLPTVVDSVLAYPGGDLVLDGEVLGLTDDDSPRKFQDTMGDFGADGEAGRGTELKAFFFDILFAEGGPVHDLPFAARRDLLHRIVPTGERPASVVTADVGEAEAFLREVIAAGHEGVVVKDLEHRYEAGRRGAAWRKVKPVHTLDLVVTAVEWGHGRRRGLLSNLHLAARADDGSGRLLMVGKTFKGMTDEMLAWQTERFLELRIEGDDEAHPGRNVVHVRPEQVVEVAVDGVQRSTRYPGGVALRFARVRGYRHDKTAEQADTITTVAALA